MHSRRHVCDVRVGVTLSRQARRHVRGLVAVVRILIATPCDLASVCRHSPHTCDAMSVTFILPSRAQRHVRDLVVIVRILIAVAYPSMTSCRRAAMLWRTRTSVSATCASAPRAHCHVRGLITIVRSYDNRTVSVHDLMSARRYPAPHPRRRVRDVHIGVMRPTSCS